MTYAEEMALEHLIDKYDLQTVVDQLGDIAREKAEHIRTNWQDDTLAKRWDGLANKLSSLSTEIAKEEL